MTCWAKPLASSALVVLLLMASPQLPGLADAAPGAGAAMTELLRSAPDTDAPLAQDCLRLLAALLRACSTYRSATPPTCTL